MRRAVVAYRTWKDHNDRRGARAAVVLYLQRIQRGDYRAAYDQLCHDELGKDYSEQDHAQYLIGQPTFTRYSVGDPTSEVWSIDGTFLTVPVQLTHPDGTVTATNYDVELTTDGPEICDSAGWSH